MKKEMLINVLQPEECRIAIVEDGVLEELYIERTSQESYVGNIYKGRIVNIEPSIQAAFVDFGIGRNGFLHVSDVDPAYYRHLEGRMPREERGGRGRRDGGRGRREDRPATRERIEEDRPRTERPHREELPPPLPLPPPAPAMAPGDERVFGAGLFDDVSSRAAPSEELPPEIEAIGESSEAAPEGDDAPGKPRRRRRGRRRGGRSRSDASGANATPADESSEGPPEIESAEHRTEEGEPSFEGQFDDESSPADTQDHFSDEDDLGDDSSESHDDLGAEESTGDEAGAMGDEFEDDESARDESAHERGGGEELEEGQRGRRGGRDSRRGGRNGGGGPREQRRKLGRDGDGRPKPPIQEIFRRGQEVLVQVIKEGIGTKGPTLSTYISVAGRYLVLMPGLNRVGVSRKIIDEEQRRRLKEIVCELEPPKGVGFIIRTAGVDRNKKELQSDLAYLLRIWQVVVQRVKKQKSPAAIYQESDMITRTIRDTFTSDIETIWVDHAEAFAHAQEFLQGVMPRFANRIKHYASTEPLFYKYGIEDEIIRIQQKKVPLPHGGSIVIEQTEALVAIDVNSGNFRADNNAEATAFQMNLHAAREIARQLRLRDLGGVIINDFIDMREIKHNREVEKTLREAVKRDRARTKVLRISPFGIIEMTRQRIRPSLKRSVFQDCPFCRGNGHVKTIESMSIDVMRLLQLAAHRDNIARVAVRVHKEVADYLLNRRRADIHKLEESGKMQVMVEGMPGAPPELLDLVCYDNHNNELRLFPPEPQVHGHRRERR
jgi:ribonuclease E